MDNKVIPKKSDLIESYLKKSIAMGGTYHQTNLTKLGEKLFGKAIKTTQTWLLDIRKTYTFRYTIEWQVIEAVGAGCTDLKDTYEVEIKLTPLGIILQKLNL